MAWVSPRTWLVGDTATAAKMNEISSSLHAIGDSWTTYTPTWDTVTTSPTLGNGVLTAAYQQTGKTIHYRIGLTWGSTTANGTGAFTFTLPVTIGSLMPVHSPVGVGTLLDASTGTVYARNAVLYGPTTIVLRDQAGTAVNGTTPVTTANGDRITILGFYEIT